MTKTKMIELAKKKIKKIKKKGKISIQFKKKDILKKLKNLKKLIIFIQFSYFLF